jgi:hypothetical protein
MWPLFLIGGAVIVGGWLWGASKVVSKSPPLNTGIPPQTQGTVDPNTLKPGDFVMVAIKDENGSDTNIQSNVTPIAEKFGAIRMQIMSFLVPGDEPPILFFGRYADTRLDNTKFPDGTLVFKDITVPVKRRAVVSRTL